MLRRPLLLLGSFVVWTLFVWVGRIRNALTDETLEGWDRNGPLLLALSFVVPAAVLALILVRRATAPSGTSGTAPSGTAAPWRPGPLLTQGTVVLVAWTTVVWVFRAGDIALGRDHEAAFVAVHLVLAVVSISLGVLALRAVLAARTERVGPTDAAPRSGPSATLTP